MSVFSNLRTTPDGEALLALVHGGEELVISSIVFGCGLWSEARQADAALDALLDQRVAASVSGVSQNGGQAEINCVLTNVGLSEGFQLTELGVMAVHPVHGEILYMADYVPPERSTWIGSGADPAVQVPVNITIACSSSSSVSIVINNEAPVTTADLAAHNLDPEAHPDIRAELAGKADAGHGHEIAEVDGLRAELDAKALAARSIDTSGALSGGGNLMMDRTLSVREASAAQTGVVELATQAEAAAGTDATRAMTPAATKPLLDAKADAGHGHEIAEVAGLQAGLDAKALAARSIATTGALTGGGDLTANRTLSVRTASAVQTGVVELATEEETIAGTDAVRAVTPAADAAALEALRGTANDWSAAQRYAPAALAIDAGVVSWDAAAAPVAVLTLTEDVAAIALTGAQPGCSYELTLLQDATGGRTVTWPSAWRWPGGSAPDVSADAGAEDLLMLSVRSGGVIRAVAAQAFAEVS